MVGMTLNMRIVSLCLRDNYDVTVDHRHMQDDIGEDFRGYGEGVYVEMPGAMHNRTFIVMTYVEYESAVDEAAHEKVKEDLSCVSDEYMKFFDMESAVDFVMEYVDNSELTPFCASWSLKCNGDLYVVGEVA